MIVTNGHGWLTTLADLSIILFMVTAADLSNAHAAPDPAPEVALATAEPVAIYRPEAGVIPFKDWLAAQPADSRQRVTVVVRHRGNDAQAQIAQGLALADAADLAGRPPRLIAEHAERDDLVVMLTYDADPEAMAHNLLKPQDQPGPEKSR